MTRCDERSLLMEASPEALRGQGDDPVAIHVRTCPACAETAGRILESSFALDQRLRQVPSFDVDALMARADAPRPRSWSTTGAWVGVAIAAGMVGILLFDGTDVLPPADPAVPVEVSSDTPAPILAIDAASSGDVAVLATTNPDITVLWFFSGD